MKLFKMKLIKLEAFFLIPCSFQSGGKNNSVKYSNEFFPTKITLGNEDSSHCVDIGVNFNYL